MLIVAVDQVVTLRLKVESIGAVANWVIGGGTRRWRERERERERERGFNTSSLSMVEDIKTLPPHNILASHTHMMEKRECEGKLYYH
jgi:hypothetical protein